MNVLDLFSGIGGFSLGLERAGFKTVAFCEIDPYCRAVIRKHWPGVPCYDDVTTLTAARLAADGIHEIVADPRCMGRQGTKPEDQGSSRPPRSERGEQASWVAGCSVDLICGGFPCQDISVAGKGAGIEGERSGLWKEYARIIGEVRPRYVIVENVSALLGRGLGVVLGDLAALGYDAEWHCIPAAAVGAPHQRDRLWIVAYSRSSGGWPNAARYGLSTEPAELQQSNGEACPDNDAPLRGDVAYADQQSPRRLTISWGECDHWLTEPDVGRVAHGVPARVDRLRALGNAVVPQIPEIIGRAIMQSIKD